MERNADEAGRGNQRIRILNQVREEVKEDPRKLSRVPESVNHDYGWLAQKKEFQLQIYGAEYYKAGPLPDYFRAIDYVQKKM
ncbi:hypothetical protein NQ317_015449 [Molorchus minor]|uniref:Uncharacterized protein n=1 Tax=Molorchus minor TaxID=1323400 RepID=A0ABQ9JSU1_9CUCU|nr:hypothetical protein NQ317_015449 [Molorchus minor]